MFGSALAVLGLLFFAPLAIHTKRLMPTARTSGDFICLRYGRSVWILFLLITQGMGTGSLLRSLSGFDYRLGMVTVIGVAAIYTLFWGMREVIGTDFIQSLLIMVMLIVVVVLWYNRFGVESIYARLVVNHPNHLNVLLPAGLLFARSTSLVSMGEALHNKT